MMWGDSRSELTYEHISDFETPILSTQQSPLPGYYAAHCIGLDRIPKWLVCQWGCEWVSMRGSECAGVGEQV